MLYFFHHRATVAIHPARNTTMTTTTSALAAVKFAAQLRRGIERAQESIAKWTAQLATNPAYAMDWSGGTFDNAAIIEVNARLLGYIGHDWQTGEPTENAAKTEADSTVIFERAKAHITSEVIRLASSVNNTSSSQTSNIMERARLAHLANLHSELNRGW